MGTDAEQVLDVDVGAARCPQGADGGEWAEKQEDWKQEITDDCAANGPREAAPESGSEAPSGLCNHLITLNIVALGNTLCTGVHLHMLSA